MAERKDIVSALLGAATALAGLLLVFIGFVYAHGESYETKRGDKFRTVAKIGTLPFTIALLCAWLCVQWLTGTVRVYDWCIILFDAALIATAVYGAATLLFYL